MPRKKKAPIPPKSPKDKKEPLLPKGTKDNKKKPKKKNN